MSKNLLDKIKRIGRKTLFTGLIAASTFYSCSKDDSMNPYIEPIKPVIEELGLKDNVNILNDKTLDLISEFNDSNISFNNSKNYSLGDIIVGGVSEKTPYGILEKITNISNDKKSFQIEETSLSDAINEGEFSFNKTLTMNDLNKKVSNKIVQSKTNGYEFSYPIDNLVIYDYDGNLETPEDQIRMNGEISFNADFDMNAKFKKGIQYFIFEANINSKSDIEISAGNKDIINSINKEKILYNENFASFVVSGPMGIPIVINPNIEISAGLIGDINGELVTNSSAELNINNKLIYENSEWTNKTTPELNFNCNKPNPYIKANIKGYVEPKLSLLIYNSAGPFVSLENYLKFVVDSESTPWWTLDVGIEAKVGVDMRRLEKYVPNYEKSIYNKEKRVAEATEPMEELIWGEDFEKQTIGTFPDNWIPDANAKSIETNKIIDEGGNKILQLYGRVGECYGSLTYHNMGSIGPYSVSMDIKNGIENNGGCHTGRAGVGLREGTSWRNRSDSFFSFDKEGNLYSRENKIIAETNLNEWQNVEIKYFKGDNPRLVYYLNNEKIYEHSGRISTTEYNLELVVQEGTAYFDNIKVKKIN